MKIKNENRFQQFERMSAAAAGAALQLSASERAAYDELFALADVDGDGQVSVAEVAFLAKSVASTIHNCHKCEKKKKKKKKIEKKKRLRATLLFVGVGIVKRRRHVTVANVNSTWRCV
jgi:hypothetical protein